jgi:hypothetical protein
VGLGKTSTSTVSRICAELPERLQAFKHRSLYDVNLVVLFLHAALDPSSSRVDALPGLRQHSVRHGCLAPDATAARFAATIAMPYECGG